MDDELQQKFAPRRQKRHFDVRAFNDESLWARTLDWRTNPYDFYRLTRAIVRQLDREYRKRWGLRVDQLANSDEVSECFQVCREWYEREKQSFPRGIYVFLAINLDLWLAGKACDVLEERQQLARMA